MPYPEIITRLPQADVPFPHINAYMLRSADGLQVFFHFTQDTLIPPHHHAGQWGMVVEGQMELTIGGVTRTVKAGDSYTIAPGEVHSANIPAGTCVIDFFEEPERYLPR